MGKWIMQGIVNGWRSTLVGIALLFAVVWVRMVGATGVEQLIQELSALTHLAEALQGPLAAAPAALGTLLVLLRPPAPPVVEPPPWVGYIPPAPDVRRPPDAK